MILGDILVSIDEEISRLRQVRKILSGRSNARPLGSGTTARSNPAATARSAKSRPKLSAEAREKIAAAQRARWAKAKRVTASKQTSA